MSPNEETEVPAFPTTVEELDAILALGTPPDLWSDAYVSQTFPGRNEDTCTITLRLPTLTVPMPTLGDISGLTQLQNDATALDNGTLALVSTVRSNLPSWVNSYLDPLFGPYIPPPPLRPLPGPIPLPIPNFFPGSQLMNQITQLVGQLSQQLVGLPPTLTPVRPTIPNPTFSPLWGRILVGSSQDIEVRIQFITRMTSTYSFGVELGTSYGVPVSAVTSAISSGDDLPWFAKAVISKTSMEPPLYGSPEALKEINGYYIAQFGLAGARTSMQGGTLKLSHGTVIPVRFNGNYGDVRVLIIPPAPCKVTVAQSQFTGPYEQDIVDAELARFTRVETLRDQAIATLTGIQNTLMMLGIAATAIPIVGAVINLSLRRLLLLVEDKKIAICKAVDTANRCQRGFNHTLAEAYPERGPIGEPEDDPR